MKNPLWFDKNATEYHIDVFKRGTGYNIRKRNIGVEPGKGGGKQAECVAALVPVVVKHLWMERGVDTTHPYGTPPTHQDISKQVSDMKPGDMITY